MAIASVSPLNGFNWPSISIGCRTDATSKALGDSGLCCAGQPSVAQALLRAWRLQHDR